MPPEINLGQLLGAYLKIMKTMTVVFPAEIIIDFIIGSSLVEKELLWSIERHA